MIDVSGGMDSSNKGGIIDKFSTGRRRLKENLAQKTGKEVADNSEFEERAQKVEQLKEQVLMEHTSDAYSFTRLSGSLDFMGADYLQRA